MHYLSALFVVAMLAVGTHGSYVTITQKCAERSKSRIDKGPLPADKASSVDFNLYQVICKDTDAYISCVAKYSWDTVLPEDILNRYVFSPRDQYEAFQGAGGLCRKYRLDELASKAMCLKHTQEMKKCFKVYSQAASKLVSLTDETLKLALACNATMAKYTCQAAEYAKCDKQLARNMQLFFNLTLPLNCTKAYGMSAKPGEYEADEMRSKAYGSRSGFMGKPENRSSILRSHEGNMISALLLSIFIMAWPTSTEFLI